MIKGMKQSWKRKSLAIIVTLAMIFSMIPAGVFAETDVGDSVDKEWWNFRNNEENNGVTDRPTPTDSNEAALKWAEKYGTGWSAAPTPPLILDGCVYVGVAKKVLKLDINTGEKLAESGDMVSNVGYGMNPILYGDGKLFVQVGNGIIQALDFKTLEPVWSTPKIASNQTVSPIAYKKVNGKGYIYTGTWRNETADGSFLCISTDNENVTDGIKDYTWKFIPSGSTKDTENITYDSDLNAILEETGNTAKRGFYWAGAYANEKYIAVGTDDGAAGSNSSTAIFYTLNPTTGQIIDKVEGIKGDIRTTTVYDNGYVYFSTKGGELYKIPIDENGNLGEGSCIDLGGMTTASPLVYKNKIYLGVSGLGGQFDPDGGHCFAVIDNSRPTLDNSSFLYKLSVGGYPQAAALLSTANENIDYDGDGAPDKRVYIYFTYNARPGGIYYTYDTPEQKNAAKDSEELFVPEADKQQYCISTICADKKGTLYYKNDSCYLMAVETNEAYLKNAKVTSEDGSEGAWDSVFSSKKSNYTIKMPTLTNKANVELDLIEGSTATINGEAYEKGQKKVIDFIDGKGEAKIEVKKNGYSRTYTMNIECQKNIAALSDLKASASNTYNSALYELSPTFGAETYDYTVDVTDVKDRSFYNIWPDSSDITAKVKVYAVSNIDPYDINEDGTLDITSSNQGHDRYAIYPEDISKTAKIRIDVTSENGEKTVSYNMTLLKKIVAESVSLNHNKYNLDMTKKLKLNATVLPEDATDKTVQWYSSNEDVATVDESGLVTPLKIGEAIITAITDSGSHTATCEVTVSEGLEKAKGEAKVDLDNYLNKTNYRDAQKIEIDTIITEGKNAIEIADNLEQVETALAKAKEKLDGVKTEEELLAEEIQEVINRINTLGDIDLESGNELGEIKDLYEALPDGAKEKVTNYSDFKKAEERYKKLTDAVSLIVSKELAKVELDNYKDKKDYREQEKNEITQFILEGKNKIDSARTKEAVAEALSIAKEKLDTVKTNEQLIKEEKIQGIKTKKVGSLTVDLSGNYKRIKASWSKVTGVDGYRVYYKLSTASKWSYVNTKSNTLYKTMSIGKKYNVLVKPYVVVDNVTYLSEVTPINKSITTLKTPSLKLTKSGKSVIKVGWNKIEGITGYEVYRGTSKKGKYTRVKTLSVKSSTWTDNKKSKGKTYYYKIRAYKKVGGKNIYTPFSTIKQVKI